jgi:hypothetical protein
MKTKSAALASAAALLFVAGASPAAHAEEEVEVAKIKCEGVNECKSHSACEPQRLQDAPQRLRREERLQGQGLPHAHPGGVRGRQGEDEGRREAELAATTGGWPPPPARRGKHR